MLKNVLTVLVIFAVTIIVGFGGAANILEKSFVSQSRQKALNKLDEKENQMLATFGTLSAVKTAVSVIEGSTVGAEAGFIVSVETNIQFGDVVQPVYDAVDIAWEASLASLFSIKLQKVLVELFSPTSSTTLFKIMNILLAISLLLYFLKDHFEIAQRFFTFTFKCAVLLSALFFLIPLAVISSIDLSENIKDSFEQKNSVNHTAVLDEINQKTATIKKSCSSSITDCPSALKDFIVTAPSLVESWVKQLETKIFFFILNDIVIPIGFLFFFIYVIKLFTNSFFDNRILSAKELANKSIRSQTKV